MANKIKLKQSSVSGKVPTTTDLDLGELGINTYDGKLFLKQKVGAVETIIDVTGAASGVTSVSGSAPILSSGGLTPAISISAATTLAAGSMSAADKTKIDAVTGTNTGDESATSIRTKLSITTLSGSNTGDQTITLTGGVTGSGTGSFVTTVVTNANLTGDVSSVGNAATLATVNANVGSFGSATNIPVIAVDAKGRITSASNTAVSIPSGSISVTGGDLTLSGNTGTAITNATLATITQAATGSFKKVTLDTKGRVTGNVAVAQADITGLLGAGSVSNAMLANGAVANLSGTNTGNETTATIKTALGITTLSGSNTGDQTSVSGSSGSCTGSAENVVTPTAGYKHLGAWGVGRVAVGAILVNTAYTADTCSGNANTVTTNANLTGAITSVGNASLLGSFTSLQLLTALTDQTGTGVNVFAVSPAFTGAPTAPTAAVGTNTTQIATTANVYASSIGQAWTDVTASRALSGTYTNSTGRTIAINYWTGGSATASSSFIVNGVTVYVCTNNTVSGVINSGMGLIVPSGATYRVLANVALVKWFELR